VLTFFSGSLILPPYPTAPTGQKALTMQIKHFISSAFTALHASITGYRPFYARDCRVVETSRYSHATDRVTGSRVYMSKPSSVFLGSTLTTGEVKRGDSGISLTVCEGGRVVWKGWVKVEDGKAMAATLNSACMKAQPRTGREMADTEWADLDRVADHAKADAQFTASLFDGV